MRNSAPLGPYSRNMPRVLEGGVAVSYERGTPVPRAQAGDPPAPSRTTMGP